MQRLIVPRTPPPLTTPSPHTAAWQHRQRHRPNQHQQHPAQQQHNHETRRVGLGSHTPTTRTRWPASGMLLARHRHRHGTAGKNSRAAADSALRTTSPAHGGGKERGAKWEMKNEERSGTRAIGHGHQSQAVSPNKASQAQLGVPSAPARGRQGKLGERQHAVRH